MTGVRCTGPAAPKPSTGVPREASVITGKPAGSDVPTVADALAATENAAANRARTNIRFTVASKLRVGSGQLLYLTAVAAVSRRAQPGPRDTEDGPSGPLHRASARSKLFLCSSP